LFAFDYERKLITENQFALLWYSIVIRRKLFPHSRKLLHRITVLHTYGLLLQSSAVCLSVCRSVIIASLAKMAESIEIVDIG